MCNHDPSQNKQHPALSQIHSDSNKDSSVHSSLATGRNTTKIHSFTQQHHLLDKQNNTGCETELQEVLFATEKLDTHTELCLDSVSNVANKIHSHPENSSLMFDSWDNLSTTDLLEIFSAMENNTPAGELSPVASKELSEFLSTEQKDLNLHPENLPHTTANTNSFSPNLSPQPFSPRKKTKPPIAESSFPESLIYPSNPQNLNQPKYIPTHQTTSKTKTQEMKSHELSPLEYKIFQDSKEAFSKYVPLLDAVNGRSVPQFLVKCLKKYHQHVSMEEFYDLILNVTTSKLATAASQIIEIPTTDSSETKLKELMFCHLLLQTFKFPESVNFHFPKNSIQNPSLSLVKFHEVIRNALAIKIIYASLIKVEKMSPRKPTVPRLSLYKVYYIICQNLMRKYPKSSSFNNIILHHSHVGKLANLVFTDLKLKKLGGRGKSKVHYVNITWNRKTVDKETLELAELEMIQLEEYFNTPGDPNTEKFQHPQENRPTQNNAHILESKTTFSHQLPAPKKPFYSHADSSDTYPESNCAPRVWTEEKHTVPKHSKWSNDNMENSLNALKVYNVDLNPFISTFNAGVFSGNNDESLAVTLMEFIHVLIGTSAPKIAHMHLHLVVLILVFPAIISSDQEIPAVFKSHLRNSLRGFLKRLKCESSNFATSDEVTIKIFTGVLEKMVALNEMTSTKMELPCIKSVLKEMVKDVEQAEEVTSKSSSLNSQLEGIYTTSIIWAMNAYSVKPSTGGISTGPQETISAIHDSLKSFKRVLESAKDAILKLPACLKTKDTEKAPSDVAYQVFRLAMEIFHDVVSTDAIISKYPMKLHTTVILKVLNLLQVVSFEGFEKRDAELSKETVKTWWFFSMMVQEYMCIMSEVVALSKRLSQITV